MMTNIVGALAEAWEEVKVQKARVIMSLIGVVAAVAAMTTVVALGNLVQQAQRERTEAWEGRSITLRFDAHPAMSDDEFDPHAHEVTWEEPVYDTEKRDRRLDEALADPIGDSFRSTMERLEVPFWARYLSTYVSFAEFAEVQNYGTVHGRPVEQPEFFTEPELYAVDPMYATIYRLQVMKGRWLTPSDSDQAVIPVVINKAMWKYLGHPDPQVPFTLTSQGALNATYRLVGVLDDPLPEPRGYIPYDSWKWAGANAESVGQPRLAVWIGEEDPFSTGDSLTSVVGANLGEGYEVYSYGGEQFGTFEEGQAAVQRVILGIGGLVIALGALGLLNVAIVTVRQRIREIGIRRAVGASSRRIFFAVFMESVVATFVAGVVGVMIAILVIRFGPWDSMDLLPQDNPAFPMSAALAGIGIATAVGALCGIIPAAMALRVRPIDAIRY